MGPEEICDDEKILKQYATRLQEHFDTVQIFVSKHDNSTNSTGLFTYGSGNKLARIKQVELWVDSFGGGIEESSLILERLDDLREILEGPLDDDSQE